MLTNGDIVTMRELIEHNPSWSRYRVSRELTQRMTTKFRNVLILSSGQSRVLNKPLSPVQRNYIKALGLAEGIFVIAQPPSLSQINLPDTT